MTSTLPQRVSLLFSTKHVGHEVDINQRIRWVKIPTSTDSQSKSNKIKSPEIIWWPCILYKSFSELRDDLDERLVDFRQRCKEHDSKIESNKSAVAYLLGFYPPLVRTLENYSCSPAPKHGEDTFRLDKEGREQELKDFYEFREEITDLATSSRASDKLKAMFEKNLRLADEIIAAEFDSYKISPERRWGLDVLLDQANDEIRNEPVLMIDSEKGLEVKAKDRSANLDLDDNSAIQPRLDITKMNMIRKNAISQLKNDNLSDGPCVPDNAIVTDHATNAYTIGRVATNVTHALPHKTTKTYKVNKKNVPLIKSEKGVQKKVTARSINADFDSESVSKVGLDKVESNIWYYDDYDGNSQTKNKHGSDRSRFSDSTITKGKKKVSVSPVGSNELCEKRIYPKRRGKKSSKVVVSNIQYPPNINDIILLNSAPIDSGHGDVTKRKISKGGIHVSTTSISSAKKKSHKKIIKGGNDMPTTSINSDKKKGGWINPEWKEIKFRVQTSEEFAEQFWEEREAEGWTLQQPTNNIHKHYYVPPNKDPTNPKQHHGFDYYSSLDEVVIHCVKQENLIKKQERDLIKKQDNLIEQQSVNSKKKHKVVPPNKTVKGDNDVSTQGMSSIKGDKKRQRANDSKEQIKNTKEKTSEKGGKKRKSKLKLKRKPVQGDVLSVTSTKNKKIEVENENKVRSMNQNVKKWNHDEESTPLIMKKRAESNDDHELTDQSSIASSRMWISNPRPDYRQPWKTLQKLNFTYNNGKYYLPGTKQKKQIQDVTYFTSISDMQRNLCEKGIPMEKDAGQDNITPAEFEQLIRWISTSSVPIKYDGIRIDEESINQLIDDKIISVLSDEDARSILLSCAQAKLRSIYCKGDDYIKEAQVDIRINGVTSKWGLPENDCFSLILWSTLSQLPTNHLPSNQAANVDVYVHISNERDFCLSPVSKIEIPNDVTMKLKELYKISSQGKTKEISEIDESNHKYLNVDTNVDREVEMPRMSNGNTNSITVAKKDISAPKPCLSSLQDEKTSIDSGGGCAVQPLAHCIPPNKYGGSSPLDTSIPQTDPLDSNVLHEVTLSVEKLPDTSEMTGQYKKIIPYADATQPCFVATSDEQNSLKHEHGEDVNMPTAPDSEETANPMHISRESDKIEHEKTLAADKDYFSARNSSVGVFPIDIDNINLIAAEKSNCNTAQSQIPIPSEVYHGSNGEKESGRTSVTKVIAISKIQHPPSKDSDHDTAVTGIASHNAKVKEKVTNMGESVDPKEKTSNIRLYDCTIGNTIPNTTSPDFDLVTVQNKSSEEKTLHHERDAELSLEGKLTLESANDHTSIIAVSDAEDYDMYDGDEYPVQLLTQPSTNDVADEMPLAHGTVERLHTDEEIGLSVKASCVQNIPMKKLPAPSELPATKQLQCTGKTTILDNVVDVQHVSPDESQAPWYLTKQLQGTGEKCNIRPSLNAHGVNLFRAPSSHLQCAGTSIEYCNVQTPVLEADGVKIQTTTMKRVSWEPNLPSPITKYHASEVLKGNEKKNSELDYKTIEKPYVANYASTKPGASNITKGATRYSASYDDIDFKSTFRAGVIAESIFGSDEPLRKKKKMEHNNNYAVDKVLPMCGSVGVDGMDVDGVGGDNHFMEFLDTDVPNDT